MKYMGREIIGELVGLFRHEPRILKKCGYYCLYHAWQGKRPEDLEDCNRAIVEQLASFLENRPFFPLRKVKKRINHKIYYKLGISYDLKWCIRQFFSSYIGNGEFIEACKRIGLIVVPVKDSENAFIYTSPERISRLRKYYIAVMK